MRIQEVIRSTGLTRKAIEYYISQGLVNPVTGDNGYRFFDQKDLLSLKKIHLYRRLDLSITEIRRALEGEDMEVLRDAVIRERLRLERRQLRLRILEKMAESGIPGDASAELEALERSRTVAEKLLEAFPGYFGRFICLHFSRFLNEPQRTEDQKAACREILEFLDRARFPEIPDDLKETLQQWDSLVTPRQMETSMETTREAIKEPESFLSENREVLAGYLTYRNTPEYLESPAYRLQVLFREFSGSSGYAEVFIPAMRRLSSSYREYLEDMQLASDRLLREFPELQERTACQNPGNDVS